MPRKNHFSESRLNNIQCILCTIGLHSDCAIVRPAISSTSLLIFFMLNKLMDFPIVLRRWSNGLETCAFYRVFVFFRDRFNSRPSGLKKFRAECSSSSCISVVSSIFAMYVADRASYQIAFPTRGWVSGLARNGRSAVDDFIMATDSKQSDINVPS